MRQRAFPQINRIESMYRKQALTTSVAAGGTSNTAITLSDLSIPANQAVKPTLALFHFGLTMNSGPVYVVVSWVIEGVSTSRSLLVTPGQITTLRLPIPRSTDFDDNIGTTAVFEIRYDNNSSSASEVTCVCEANFLGMPLYV